MILWIHQWTDLWLMAIWRNKTGSFMENGNHLQTEYRVDTLPLRIGLDT